MSQNQFTENGLCFRHWPTTNDETKAAVLLVHGLGEHCQRYTSLATALNSAGYALCSIDLPGHGLSDGPRGHINRFSDFQNAALTLHAKIQQWYPDKAIFLLGHSMGGLISTRLLLDHQHLFKGALLSGAGLESPQQPPKWQVGIIKFVSTLFPTLGMMTLDASGISRDSAVVNKYMADPLINKGKLSARFLAEMLATMEECKAGAPRIQLPIRIMHGGDDVITAVAGSQFLNQNVSSDDKELKIYNGLYHEIFNEPEAKEIVAEIIDWLDRHLV